MIVIASRHEAPVNLAEQRSIDRPILRELSDPPVGRDCRGRLFL
jgi:hypothetical protein